MCKQKYILSNETLQLFVADRDALHLRFHVCGHLDARVRPQEGLQSHHLHDPRLRRHLAQGDLPSSQRRLLDLAFPHAGHRDREVSDASDVSDVTGV